MARPAIRSTSSAHSYVALAAGSGGAERIAGYFAERGISLAA
ncbi:MAG TPA: hypothetical protein VMI72_13660 [Roseiarcus sp.]|nr:hypothetical protein [Roseiarcus sp.]